MKELLEKMVEAKQLSATDAETLMRQCGDGSKTIQSEEDVLRWLAAEYGVAYTDLENVELDRELLSLFPARILLKEELLPLKRVNGSVEVATSRLFASQGLDTLKAMTGLKLKPVLAPTEAIQREMKKRLGVGADTIDTLDEEARLQVVDEEAARKTPIWTARRKTPRSSGSSTRFCGTPSNCAPRTFTSNRSSTSFGSATGLTACCRKFRCRRSSSDSSRPSSRASRF